MLDVLSYVNDYKRELKREFKKHPARLAIVTDNRNFDANQSYIRSKTKFADEVGVACDVIVLPEDQDFINNVQDYTGIIVQYPFRDYDFNTFRKWVSERVPADKDVDGLCFASKFKPCTPLGILFYLDHLRCSEVLPINGNIVINVIGCGGLVGKPLVEMLNERTHWTVCVTRSKTDPRVAEMFHACSKVVVCATPNHNIIRDTYEDTVYIDAGCNLVDGKLLGNVSRGCYSDKARITPVPNGVGRLTVLALFSNLLEAKIKSIAKIEESVSRE